MKTRLSKTGLRAFACAASALISLGLAGEPKAQGGVIIAPTPVAQGTILNASAEAGMLRQAYGLLATADHDYKGNRVKAMKSLEAAAKQLGISLSGDGKVREPQGASDAQLRSAQTLLAQASAGLSGAGLKHIQQAIQHLNVALAIQ
jgi:hypothetical protein